jgi:hypothetical protein
MNVAEIPEALKQLGLLSANDIVQTGVTVTDCSRRNRNFRVEIGSANGLLVKYAHNEDTARSLAAEAAAYTAIQNLAAYSEARRWIPRLHHWDPNSGRLILDLLPKGLSLQELRKPPAAAYSAMGEALAAVHLAGTRADQRPAPALPWALSLHRPTVELFSELSVANVRLIEIVQNQASICLGLDRLLDDWTSDSTIHGDIKWDNWVVELNGERALERLALVDWELACYGDSAWDIGATFSEFLGQWVESVPVTIGAAPSNFPSLARKPLAKMQPAIRNFWSAYVEKRGWPANIATWNLLRAVRMAAARLLQRTWERHQRAYDLTGHGVVSVQVASHIMREPHLAAVRLLGLALS